VCSNKTRLFVLRSTAVTDASRHRPSRLFASLSLRSGASSPTTVVAAPPAPGGRHDDHGLGREADDVEDLILDNESRRTVMNGTRGIAQLAASRRAARQPRPLPSSYVTLCLFVSLVNVVDGCGH